MTSCEWLYINRAALTFWGALGKISFWGPLLLKNKVILYPFILFLGDPKAWGPGQSGRVSRISLTAENSFGTRLPGSWRLPFFYHLCGFLNSETWGGILSPLSLTHPAVILRSENGSNYHKFLEYH